MGTETERKTNGTAIETGKSDITGEDVCIKSRSDFEPLVTLNPIS